MSRLQDSTTSTDAPSDRELVDRTRLGDSSAFAELWRRHYRAGLAVARSFTGTFDPDDLVSESFLKVFRAISGGGGPSVGFRPYLFTSIRNTASSWGRASNEVPIDDAETIADLRFTEETELSAIDQSLAARAFRKLPAQWQEVLWYTEVEGMAPREVAPLLGLSANATAVLAYRAREGLRASWVQVHLASQPADADADCTWTVERLGASFRGRLTKSNQRRIDAHLEDCDKCRLLAQEAGEVNHHLRAILLPLVIGAGAAGGYTAWLATSGGPAAYAAEGAGLDGLSATSGAHVAPPLIGGAAKVTILVAAAVLAVTASAAVAGIVISQETTGVSTEGGGLSTSQPLPPRQRHVISTPTPSGASPTVPPVVAPPSPAVPPAAPSPEEGSAPPQPLPEPNHTPAPDEPVVPVPIPPNPTDAAPSAPTVISPEPGSLESNLLVAHGTAEPSVTITVLLTDSHGAIVAQAADTSTPSGLWTTPIRLTDIPDGVYTLSVAATRGGATGPATSVPVTIGRTLAAPTVGPADSDSGRLLPVLSGTGIPGATIHAIAGSSDSTTTVDAGGDWMLQVVDGLTAGDNSIGVQQSQNGIASAVTTIDLQLRAPTVSVATSSNLTTVTVLGDPAAGVELRIDNGAWTPHVLDSTGMFAMPVAVQGGATIDTRYGIGARYGLTVTTPAPPK